jgi:hypothetical protein
MDHELDCPGDHLCDCAPVALRLVTLDSGRMLWQVRPAPLADGPLCIYVPAELWARAVAPRTGPLGSSLELDCNSGDEDSITHRNTITTDWGAAMKTKPVAVLTVVYTALMIALGTAAVTEALPPLVVTIATGVALIIGVILGVRTYNSVTPLAAPKTASGRPAQLVALERGRNAA